MPYGMLLISINVKLNKMKILNKLSVVGLLMAVLLTGCEKENVDRIIPQSPNYTADTVDVNPLIKQMKAYSSDTFYISCISVPFPIDFLQASGNVITVSSEIELNTAMELADSIVDFVYPFTAVDSNQVIVIQKGEDLVKAIVNCSLITGPSDCDDFDAHTLLFFNALNILTTNNYVYDINYPVTLLVEGNQVVLNKDDDYLPAIGGSPFRYKETELVYPITITQFGQNIVLNSDQDVCDFYQTLNEACGNKPPHIQFFFNEGGGTAISCTYFINYPVDITLGGNVLQIKTRKDYLNLLNSSATAYNDIDLIYPVGATKYMGNTQLSFSSDADLCQYLDNCR